MIKFYTGMSFSLFVNKYRIQDVIKELERDEGNSKFTLAYIYSKAGFKNQTTFNKYFKDIMKMTPSEYMKK